MTIYDYAKLSNEEKESLLKEKALLLEVCTEEKDMILVYFLDGFFVEVTINRGKVIYNLPYKNGYIMDQNKLFQVFEKTV
jgi:hypothetical protein